MLTCAFVTDESYSTTETVKFQGKIRPRTDHEGPEGVEVKLYSLFNLDTRWG